MKCQRSIIIDPTIIAWYHFHMQISRYLPGLARISFQSESFDSVSFFVAKSTLNVPLCRLSPGINMADDGHPVEAVQFTTGAIR